MFKNPFILNFFFILIICFTCQLAHSQITFNDYSQYYVIGEDPGIRYMTSYRKEEKILFELNPVIKLGLYNNFMKGIRSNYRHTQAWYFSMVPQIRVYNGNSLPVKTPSYKGLVGTQHLFRLTRDSTHQKRDHFLGISLESGHFSNGQVGCSFSQKYEDRTPACDSIYNLITPDTDLSAILNRKSGNFSTNVSQVMLNYRYFSLHSTHLPKAMQSFIIGYLLYHKKLIGIGNLGGYSEQDIRIYGRHRYLFGYEYMRVFGKGNGSRISIKQNLEWIQGAHKSVNPLRSETSITYYPFNKSKAPGIIISYIYGHDNYHYRFVDSGQQGTIGLTWSQLPPFPLTNMQ